MGLTNTVDMRDEVDIKLRQYIDGIKIRTKGNLNDGAVDAEGFFRNLLNLLYDFNLSKDKIKSAHNETIDLHCIERGICVQVTAQNNRDKVNETIKHFIENKRFGEYKQLHFIILDRERNFRYDINKLKSYGVAIFFHDISSIFKILQIDFDHPDKMKEVYDFVMKDLDKGYGRKASKKKQNYHNNYKDDDLKGKHIIDQLYIVLKRFEGFKCIYPRTLSKLYPFNIEKRTFDSYSNYCLKTNNKEIHELLQKIKVSEKNKIKINDVSLKPFSRKLNEIFKILNNSLIYCICYREKYTEIEHHNITLIKYNPECSCNQCLYQKFNTQPLFDLLKEKWLKHSDNLVSALGEGYYWCKLGEHIKGWQIFDSIIEKKSTEKKKPVTHFLAQYNSYAIYNFVDSPWWQNEAKSLLPKIEEIDLHGTLCHLEVNGVVQKELIKLKEKYHLNYSREKIEEYAKKISEIKVRYAGGGLIYSTPPIGLLREEMNLLFSFYTRNSIIIDDFFTFRATITKAIEAFFISYVTDNRYEYKYKAFDHFVLIMIIFYVDEDSIKRIFQTYDIEKIEILKTEKESFIELMTNFFTSQFTLSTWNEPKFYEDINKQEYFSHYRQLLRHLFNRLCFFCPRSI